MKDNRIKKARQGGNPTRKSGAKEIRPPMTTDIIESENDSRKMAATAALGNIGKNASTYLDDHRIKALLEPTDALVSRYALQSGAREILGTKSLNGCHRYPTKIADKVDVLRSEKLSKACYKNLQTCKSVWQCPVCASKISERRRQELERAVTTWRDLGGTVLLATYTIQHYKTDNLSELLGAMKKARKGLLSGREADAEKKRYRVAARVRSLEVTYGENGWHPHYHELIFSTRPDIDVREMERKLLGRWESQVVRNGLRPVNDHGLDIFETHDEIADYVQKFGRLPERRLWNQTDEVTKQTVKRGKTAGGKSMMELLADYTFGLDEEAGRVWKQYAETFKGERQLRWSGRNQVLFDVEETDAEIMERADEEMALFASITLDDWRVIVGSDARAEVLSWASSGDHEAFMENLRALGCQNEIARSRRINVS